MEALYEQMIEGYQPSDRARTLLGGTKLVLMVGVTGVGRDTIISQLVAKGGYYPLVTATTRLARVNNGVMEQDGVEYYFLTEAEAKQHIEAGEYVEVSSVHDRINGLLVNELQRAQESGKVAITDIDPQGARKYHVASEGTTTAIFVLPPSYEEWMNRNRSRYATEAAFEEAWPRRRKSAIMELEMAVEDSFYQFVINDELSRAVDACDAIIQGESQSPETQERSKKLIHTILSRLRTDG